MASATDLAGYRSFMELRRARIMGEVERAAQAAGRDPSTIEVCAVSKTVGVDEVRVAMEAGYTSFAENRPQELERKLSLLDAAGERAGTRWHMIGNLQTNKINHVLGCRPELVHSVCSLDLARAIAKRAAAHGLAQRALIEVNVSGEESKSGVSPQELVSGLRDWLEVGEGLVLCGLMTMAPNADPCAARSAFEGLRALRDEIAAVTGSSAIRELSMGMSGDYREAIMQGATIIRLGRIVFDPEYPFE